MAILNKKRLSELASEIKNERKSMAKNVIADGLVKRNLNQTFDVEAKQKFLLKQIKTLFERANEELAKTHEFDFQIFIDKTTDFDVRLADERNPNDFSKVEIEFDVVLGFEEEDNNGFDLQGELLISIPVENSSGEISDPVFFVLTVFNEVIELGEDELEKFMQKLIQLMMK